VNRTDKPFLLRFGLADRPLVVLLTLCTSAAVGHLRALFVSIRDRGGGLGGLASTGIICNLSEDP
jgi:hypothetical protein